MSIRKEIFRSFGFVVVSLAVFYIVILLLFRPSHDREWQLGHEALPQIVYSTESSQISIANYRNFAWTEVNAADIQYETRSFDLDQMSGVDVIISHFDDFEGLAHIFLSFGLSFPI